MHWEVEVQQQVQRLESRVQRRQELLVARYLLRELHWTKQRQWRERVWAVHAE